MRLENAEQLPPWSVRAMNVAILGVNDWNVAKAMQLYEKVSFKVAKKDLTYEKEIE